MSTLAPLSQFTGELIGPNDPGYDEARGLFNGRIDKRPALIARCTSAEDVRAALAHARENDLVVAVRGGGHSTAGHSTCDDGIVIDTGPMKKAEIDVEHAHGALRRRAQLGRARRRHAGARPGGHRRARDAHGRRRADARQRVGLARAQVRGHLREPHLRRGRDRGRPGAPRQRGREPRAALGPQGRRRQLRRRDRVRVPPAPGRAARVRRDDHAPARGGPGADALLPRLHGEGAGRGRRRPGAAHGAARGLRAGGDPRQARRGADPRLRGRPAGGRGVLPAADRVGRAGASRWCSPCPTPRCRR